MLGTICNGRPGLVLSILLTAAMLGAPFLCGQTAFAQSRRLIVEVGKGLKLDGTQNVESVFVADSNIADISKSPGDAHYIYGKAPGETTIIASDLSGKTLFTYDLVVIHGLSELKRMLSRRFQVGNLSISSARGSVLVSGIVDNEFVRQNLLTSLKSGLPDSVLIDELIVRRGKLVRLDVKLLEIARNQLEQYGIDWLALLSGSGGARNIAQSTENLNSVLNLLIDNGAATIAAESTLVTTNNRKATFSVGEEIAIPTFINNSNNGPNYAVDFKFVGIEVNFTPIWMPDKKVGLDIDSTSSNAQTNSRRINGNSFPNLSFRKLMTHVELESGRSFVVGGLSRLETSAALQKPRGEEVGFLRFLFGAERIESSQKDLIIVVTPHFDEAEKPTVAESVRIPQSNLEFILSRRAKISKLGAPTAIRIFGPAGFLY